ncbi:carbohydrate kinase [bacterium]|nr:carbohydrate kinase [bacterium]
MPSQKLNTVLAIGELLWDVLPSGKMLGGAPANYCFRLRQLGVPALMVSRVGVDSLGDELISNLTNLDFDLSLLQHDANTPTGTVDVTLTSDGNPSFTINPNVAYDNLEWNDSLEAAAKEATFVCFGTLAQRGEQSRSTIYKILDSASNATKFLDINLRKNCYNKETLRRSLELTNILKLNQSEVGLVKGLLDIETSDSITFSEILINQFDINTILITLGEKGVLAIDKSLGSITVPGIPVTVVDTIGSGDSFSAGFTFKYLSGASLQECCQFGNITGAMHATYSGGMPIITRKSVKDFIHDRHLSEVLF